MTLNKAKLIEVLDYQKQQLKETKTVENAPARPDAKSILESMEYKSGIPGLGRMRLAEVAAVTTSQFPSLLRDGLRPILFSSYAGIMQTWQEWAFSDTSDKPDEVYLEGSQIGLIPAVGEGAPYPTIDLALDRTVQITNVKYGAILPITREMVLFDRVQMINQMVQNLGEAAARTKEQNAYNVLTTAGNYTRNSTTGDNDYGANTAGTQFSPAGLVTANNVLVTMKDRKSGAYLGINPDTLILGPDLEFAAKQLLFSDQIWRSGSGSATNDVYGTGVDNPFRGRVKQIIVSPRMSVGNWVLCEAKKFIKVQQVWGVELFQTTAVPENFNFMHNDIYEYRVDEMYGIGMLNDRFAYYSSSTSAPIAN